MMDIFMQKDVSKLLRNKTIVFMGDSNIRALYKDFLCLSQNNTFISQKVLKTKMENSCFGDKLLTHGPKTNGRSYREEREAYVNKSKFSFYFLTCVYDKYVEEVLDYISRRSNMPDVLIVNSCLWDVTRWGPNGVELFKTNLVKLMKELKRLMPDCLVIWLTAPPIACEVKGGFLVKELAFLRYSLRFHVMEANQYARKVVVSHGFDILDTHYHLKMQLHRREDDGIHWKPAPVRYLTNLLLTHISIAWNVSLPHRYKSDIKEENSECIPEKEHDIKNKPTSKMASVIEKPATNNNKTQSPERVIEIKKKKENLKSKTPHRKRKRPGKGRGLKLQESHHAYLNRATNRQRSKRIKRWQSSMSEKIPFRTDEKIQDFADDSILFEDQHDSGYFPSPKKTSLLGTRPDYLYDTPVYTSCSYQMPLLTDPDMENFSRSHVPYYYERDNRNVIISSTSNRQPYIFPNVDTHNFQPLINFAYDVPLSFKFS